MKPMILQQLKDCAEGVNAGLASKNAIVVIHPKVDVDKLCSRCAHDIDLFLPLPNNCRGGECGLLL
jgi:hypothetical protein